MQAPFGQEYIVLSHGGIVDKSAYTSVSGWRLRVTQNTITLTRTSPATLMILR